MIKQDTVIVLGAGASMPYDYPSGEKLVENILGGLKGGQRQFLELRDIGFSTVEIESFRDALHHSGYFSIDAFLEYRQEFLRIGKTAIAQAIIACELPDTVFERSSSKWYRALKDCLMAPIDRFHLNRLTVITFNYDRSLEFFLYKAFLNSWSAEEKDVISALRSIRIFHVHGKLGNLPWELDESRGRRPYGVPKSFEDLARSAELINVVHESVQQSGHYKRAIESLETAKRILFLGFGYHDINLDLLGLRRWDPIRLEQDGRLVTGTRMGLTQKQCERLTGEFPALKKISQTHFQRQIHEFLREDVLLNS